jgi:hypothetical protein
VNEKRVPKKQNREKCIMMSFMTCVTNVYSDDQITDGDTGEACGKYGGEEKFI